MMLVRHRPLRPGVDDDLLVERSATTAALNRALGLGENVLVVGPAGSGKSTLANYLVRDLERRQRPVVLIHAGLATSTVELIELIDSRLPRKTVRASDAFKALPPFAAGQITLRGPENPAIELANAIRRLEREQPTTIVLDELSDTDIARTLFGRARDALWAVGHQWVLAARPEQEAVLTTPPADAFWPIKVDLPPWTGEEARELLARREIPTSSPPPGRTPRNILIDAIRPTQDAPQPDTAHDAISSTDARVLDALVALDRPVTAGDEELLVRLGWSPSHVQRVLRGLAESGHITATAEPPRGPGRPRLVYRAHTVPDPSQ